MRLLRVALMVGVCCSNGLLSVRMVGGTSTTGTGIRTASATAATPTTATATATTATATTAMATTTATSPTTATASVFENNHPFRGGWGGGWGGGGGGGVGGGGVGGEGGIGGARSWLSEAALKMKPKCTSLGSSRAKQAWTAYELRKSELEGNPQDPRLQLDTAEALLKWMRHTTNGNFPRASTGEVSEGDSPASRTIWRKHAPEALRLLKAAAVHAQQSGTYDLAKYRFLHAEASTYLSSAKGILRAALQADAVKFKRNVRPLIDHHPAYQGGVGHTFMGAFYLAAPWPVHNVDKAKAHFDAALKIDSRCPRNHYCRGLVALKVGDTAKAKASFQRALKCKPTSPEEEDVKEFFFAESRAALRALEKGVGRRGAAAAGVPLPALKLASDW